VLGQLAREARREAARRLDLAACDGDVQGREPRREAAGMPGEEGLRMPGRRLEPVLPQCQVGQRHQGLLPVGHGRAGFQECELGRFRPSERLGRRGPARVRLELVGCERHGARERRCRRLGATRLRHGGGEPELGVEPARVAAKRRLEPRPGAGEIALPQRQVGFGQHRLGRERMTSGELAIEPDGVGMVEATLEDAAQEQAVVQPVGLECHQGLAVPQRPLEIALRQERADQVRQRLAPVRPGGHERLDEGEGVAEPVLCHQGLGEPEDAARVAGMRQERAVPAALRLDEVARVLRDPGELAPGPPVLGCQLEQAAGVRLGAVVAALGAQAPDHAEPRLEMARRQCQHPPPVAEREIGAAAPLDQPGAGEAQLEVGVAGVDGRGKRRVGLLVAVCPGQGLGERDQRTRRERRPGLQRVARLACRLVEPAEGGVEGGHGGDGLGLARVAVGEPEEDALGLVRPPLGQKALDEPEPRARGPGRHKPTIRRTPQRRSVSPSVARK
jgi:hypothetical protein